MANCVPWLDSLSLFARLLPSFNAWRGSSPGWNGWRVYTVDAMGLGQSNVTEVTAVPLNMRCDYSVVSPSES